MRAAASRAGGRDIAPSSPDETDDAYQRQHRPHSEPIAPPPVMPKMSGITTVVQHSADPLVRFANTFDSFLLTFDLANPNMLRTGTWLGVLGWLNGDA